MSISFDIPDAIYQEARTLAEAHHLPVEELFVSAFAEQLPAWQRLLERRARGGRTKFLSVLDNTDQCGAGPRPARAS
jgi:hypothetical protein